MADGDLTWLVTGAATGFGHAIAMSALAAGHNVVVTARDPDRLSGFIEAHGHRATALKLDVTDAAAASDIIRVAEDRIKANIDIVVNAAGYGLIGAVEEVNDEECRALFETHLFSVINITKGALPGMRSRKRGHFFNFSSVAGIDPSPGTAHYSAAKFAIEGFSDGLAKEVAGFGIKLTVVEPGPFQTSFFTGSSGRTAEVVMPEYFESVGPTRSLMQTPPTWCPGDPKRAADAIVRLALDPNAPLRLPLGAIAHNVALSALQRRLAEVHAFRDVSNGADFPEAAGRAWP